VVDVLELILKGLDFLLEFFYERLVLELDLLSVDHALSFFNLFLLIVNRGLLLLLLQMQNVLLVDDGCAFNSLLDVLVQMHVPG
jgi:hypothetical protein